jgi:hypothetical protein
MNFREVGQKCLLASSRRSVCPSVHMEKLIPYGKHFRGILYLGFILKSVNKFQVSLKSNNFAFASHENLT